MLRGFSEADDHSMGMVKLPNFEKMANKMPKKKKLMKGSHPLVINSPAPRAPELPLAPLPVESPVSGSTRTVTSSQNQK